MRGLAVGLRDVVHGDDSGVAHAGGGTGLALHPHAQVGQFGPGGVRVGAQFLEGDLAAEHLVDRAPHDSHAAAAELFPHPVPPGEEAAAARLFLIPEDTAAPSL